MPRIDAGASQKQESLNAREIRRMDGIRRHHQVVIQEFGRIAVVGMDSTDFRRSKNDKLRFFLLKKKMDRGLVAQIQFGAISQNQLDRLPRLAVREPSLGLPFPDGPLRKSICSLNRSRVTSVS